MLPQAAKYRSTASLNVRGAPTTTSKILGRLVVDDVIEKVDESEDGKWVKFLFKGQEGWSSKRYRAKVPYIPPLGEDFPWMVFAENEKGVSEIPGSRIIATYKSMVDVGSKNLRKPVRSTHLT